MECDKGNLLETANIEVDGFRMWSVSGCVEAAIHSVADIKAHDCFYTINKTGGAATLEL